MASREHPQASGQLSSTMSDSGHNAHWTSIDSFQINALRISEKTNQDIHDHKRNAPGWRIWSAVACRRTPGGD
jgi:hypothetical protein